MIKLIFPILLAIACSTVHADEQPELSTSLANTTTPLILTSARNIELTLIPDDELNNIDLWQRLRGSFTMQELDSPLIAKHEQWYASRPEYIARMMDRGSRYLYYITSEVERRGMPGEIALLPMIESAFNPGAYSTS
ncbi:MAG: lytic transglycosylase, partial [Gallionella sp.]|nr:lytic transglycosylase [Gallionella sp.]